MSNQLNGFKLNTICNAINEMEVANLDLFLEILQANCNYSNHIADLRHLVNERKSKSVSIIDRIKPCSFDVTNDFNSVINFVNTNKKDLQFYTCEFHLANLEVKTERLFVRNDSKLCFFKAKSNLVGNYISDYPNKINKISFTPKTTSDVINGWKKDRAYILKNTKFGLWSNLVKAFNNEYVLNLVSKIEKTNPFISKYDFWTLMDYNDKTKLTNSFTGNKRLTLKSAGASEGDIEYIKQSLKNKQEFSVNWRKSCDYRVSAKICDDGVYRAWLSQEYKGCSNGHYYNLISDTQAIYTETD